MAPSSSSWLEKLRYAIIPSSSSATLAVLAFDAAAAMSRILHLWRSLSDLPSRLLRPSPAFCHLVPTFLDAPSLARAELLRSLLLLSSSSLLPLSLRCSAPHLRRLLPLLHSFASLGLDPHRWSLPDDQMDSLARKMDRLVSSTSQLYAQIDSLARSELYLNRLLQYSARDGGKLTSAVTALKDKIHRQRQEISRLKDTSLWRRSFDSATSILARAAFSVLARIKRDFPTCVGDSFWEANTAVLVPPPGTLGAEGLALRYAHVVVAAERMVKSPGVITPEARDELYGLLPSGVRSGLRTRLRGVGTCAATDAALASQWRVALTSLTEWLAPVAHATLRWLAERSPEKRSGGGGDMPGALLLETLHYARRDRAEEAVVELLVGLNYVWRFEMQARMVGLYGKTCLPDSIPVELRIACSPINVEYEVDSTAALRKSEKTGPPISAEYRAATVVTALMESRTICSPVTAEYLVPPRISFSEGAFGSRVNWWRLTHLKDC